MSIIEKWKTKREIKKILESNDKVKLDRVEEFQKDENLENIILSIDDKEKRAQAFKRNAEDFRAYTYARVLPVYLRLLLRYDCHRARVRKRFAKRQDGRGYPRAVLGNLQYKNCTL